MIHGALTKSPRSFDIVTKEVDTIDVSRVEIKRPLSSLSSLELERILYERRAIRYDQDHLLQALDLLRASIAKF
jgi:hypothetical protein